jgi:hypothetical protein
MCGGVLSVKNNSFIFKIYLDFSNFFFYFSRKNI